MSRSLYSFGVRLFLILIVWASFQGTAWTDTYEDAEAAKRRGDYETALRLWKEAANDGNIDAVWNIARAYDQGEGVPQDQLEASKWYRLAAEQGLRHAEFRLGLMYFNGEGVEKDWSEAEFWLRRAADNGSPGAQELINKIEQAKSYERYFSRRSQAVGVIDLIVDVEALDGEAVSVWCDVLSDSQQSHTICKDISSGQFIYLDSRSADKEDLRFMLENCGTEPRRKSDVCEDAVVKGIVDDRGDHTILLNIDVLFASDH